MPETGIHLKDSLVEIYLNSFLRRHCRTQRMSSPVMNGNGYPQHRTRRRPTICSETCLVDPYYQPKHLRQKAADFGNVSVDLDGQNETTARLLVLYTGGTIGMKTNSDGAYVPAPNFMIKRLRQLPMFHDTDYPMPFHESDADAHDDDAVPLVMPLSKEGKRVFYQVCEYEPLLDSCNMTMTDWARLAFDIDKNYDKFDGFVILHGTDTMAYTASALSFMLEDLGKPVVLTGSQIPIFETRSDGRDNFLGALIMAGHYNIPEVTIYFNNKLMRGNRTTKVDSGAFDAFNSPNLLPLAQLEIDIMVNWDAIFRPASLRKFSIHTNMNPNVGLLRLFPSITTATVKAFLQPPMEGVVVQTYGAGNGPDSRKDLMEVFEEAAARGVLIINITQCARGAVNAAYAAGKVLLNIGIIPGGDMTPEAALTKLSYALGKPHWSIDERRQMIQENIRGEKRQIASSRGTNDTLLEFPLLGKLKETLRISSSEEVQVLKEAIYPSLLCAAGREGNIQKLEELQKNGAQFNQTDYDGRSALHVAASEGHLEAVKFLLKNGTSVHSRDRYGNSPLDDAIRFNHHEVIKILVQTGAHLNLSPSKLGTMLCNHLRERHHPNIPDTLVKGEKYYLSGENDINEMQSWHLAGADINQGDYDQRTALHVAVCHNNKPMVEYLLSIGAKSNLLDSAGLTALDEAKKRDLDELVEMLLNNQNE